MNGLNEMLIKEQRRLKGIIHSVAEELKTSPAGSLRLSKSHNITQYYHMTADRESRNGRYIPKQDLILAKQLAQKEYNEQVLKLAGTRLKQINGILKDYRDDEIEQLYRATHAERKKLIRPVEPTWEQQVAAWYAVPFSGKGFAEDAPTILTEKGERVRSKSEKIIADFLCSHGIVYKYECPLYLKGYGSIYPDFTILSPRSGQEIYLEHEGRMDDPAYAETAVRKIELYERNGIFPGERLILTFETAQTVLNMKLFERQLQHVMGK